MKDSEFFLEISRGFALAERTGCNAVLKFNGSLVSISASWQFDKDSRHECMYEIALSVVKGRAVFKGDRLWSVVSGKEYIANEYHGDAIITTGGLVFYDIDLSWNPTKPKTVMVELLQEDAQWIAEFTGFEEYVNDLQYKLNLARVFIDSSCSHSPDQINCGACTILKDTEVTSRDGNHHSLLNEARKSR